jgi:hypothetical protein
MSYQKITFDFNYFYLTIRQKLFAFVQQIIKKVK